jgi:hypothetical protein
MRAISQSPGVPANYERLRPIRDLLLLLFLALCFFLDPLDRVPCACAVRVRLRVAFLAFERGVVRAYFRFRGHTTPVLPSPRE